MTFTVMTVKLFEKNVLFKNVSCGLYNKINVFVFVREWKHPHSVCVLAVGNLTLSETTKGHPKVIRELVKNLIKSNFSLGC